MFDCPIWRPQLNGLVDCAEQVFVAEWFREKFESPRFHGAHTHLDVAVTGDENNWNLSIAAGQFPLQVKTIYSRYLYIEHQAADSLSRRPGQKLLCRTKCLYLQPRGAEQKAQAFPDRRVVINYTDQRWPPITPTSKSWKEAGKISGPFGKSSLAGRTTDQARPRTRPSDLQAGRSTTTRLHRGGGLAAFDVRIIQILLGHCSLATTDKYLCLAATKVCSIISLPQSPTERIFERPRFRPDQFCVWKFITYLSAST